MTLSSMTSDDGGPTPRGMHPARPGQVRPAGNPSLEHGRPAQNRSNLSTMVRGTRRRRQRRPSPPPYPPPEDAVGRLERVHRDLRDMYVRGMLPDAAVRDLPNLFRALGINVELDVEAILGTRSNNLPD
uniref:Uncharacterized protein n=2 Tax=Ixodes ricinus TaxID=34613 RepID=V5HRW9_IXORI